MIRQASKSQLRLFLLAAEGVKCCAPAGEVFLFRRNRYWSENLVEHIGRKIVVRFDPDDLLAGVYAYTLAGEFICEAPAIEAVGYANIDDAKRGAQLRREFKKIKRQAAEAELKVRIEDLASMLPRSVPTTMPPPKITRIVRAAARTALAGAPRAAEEQAAISFGIAVRAIADSENVLPFPGAGE